MPRRYRLSARLLALFVLAGGMLLGAPAAYADESTEASAARAQFADGGHIYVSSEAGQQLDSAAVADEIGGDPVFIAVVPPNLPPESVLLALRDGTEAAGTYVVVSGTQQAAQSSVICSDLTQPLLDKAAKAQQETRAKGELTAFLVDFVKRVADAPAPGDAGCSEPDQSTGGGFLSALPWILGAIVVGVGGGYLWLRNRRTAKAARMTQRRGAVAAALDELARDIDAVPGGSDEHTERALQDARERHIAAADILTAADNQADFDAAQRAVREGWVAANFARQRVGLATAGDVQVQQPLADPVDGSRVVMIGDEPVMAHARYQPGAPYYFAGSEELPSGWYEVPVGADQLFAAIGEDDE